MKTLLPTLLISAVLATSANADQGKGKRGVNIDQVVASLQLDATQAASLKALMESHRAERKALREQGNKDREQRQTLRKQNRQAILDVLGYEKMYKFEELIKENRSNRRMKSHSKRKNKQQ